MPNGRSGGFLITILDLKRLIEALPGSTVIGALLVQAPPIRPTTASEFIPLLNACSRDRVGVEDQDHKAYVVHLSDEPQPIWLVVDSKSQLFTVLQQTHTQWLADHPGWTGWVAF